VYLLPHPGLSNNLSSSWDINLDRSHPSSSIPHHRDL
jgi:hypothetical protein